MTRAGARAVEQSYNLVDAIERFGYDADCALFDLILRGELWEEVYYAEEKLIEPNEPAIAATPAARPRAAPHSGACGHSSGILPPSPGSP